MSEGRVVTQPSGIGRLIENVDRVIKGKTAAYVGPWSACSRAATC